MFIRVVILLAMLMMSSCGGEISTEPIQKVLFIDSYADVCVGEGWFLCLRARENEDDDFTLIDNAIEGFDFSWGHRYQLEIEEIEIENPPADGSSTERYLVAVLADDEDEVGTEYHLEFLTEGSIFNKQAGGYALLQESFTCAEGIDCEELLAFNDRSRIVKLTFTYLGDSQIRLVDWEEPVAAPTDF